MAHAKEPLTRGTKKGGSELTGRGQEKVKGQIRRAQSIMDAEVKAGKHLSDTFKQARAMKGRAEKLLNKPKKSTSPGKKDVHAKRREPFEKATRTDRTKRFLEGVAQRANDANKE